MTWVNLFVLAVLALSFFSGMKEGAIKSTFSLIGLFIAIPLSAQWYARVADVFSFLPGENWQSFVGFYVVFGLVTAIFHIALLLPRKAIEVAWKEGCIFRFIGGGISAINAAIGFAVFTIVIQAFPIFGWLADWASRSGILSWLVARFPFVQSMLSGLLTNPPIIT